jgi:predicted RNA-binding Zn-ribbon protein involved in translation (DUF1610 family)
MSDAAQLRCLGCGHVATPGDDWSTAHHPTLGTVTQCPDCGSTQVQRYR